MTPDIIIAIATIFFSEICSLKNNTESSGTKRYPSDSMTDISLSLTPRLITKILIKTDTPIITYPPITHTFKYSLTKSGQIIDAPFFSIICAKDATNTLVTANKIYRYLIYSCN